MRTVSVTLICAGLIAEMVFGLFVFRWPLLVNRMTFAARGAVVVGFLGVTASYLWQRTAWGTLWATVAGAAGTVHLLVLLRGLHLSHLI